MPSPSSAPRVRKRVWTIGRFLLLAGALLLTYAAFFLGALGFASRAREVTVPDVRGKSLAEATSLMADAGLVLKVELPKRADETVPADHVLSQEPSPGFRLRRDRAVKVKVSEGQLKTDIPSLVGQSERTAQITLAQSKVTVAQRSEIQNAAYDVDAIVAQDPPAKSHGASVSILVNHGGAGLTYVMPDLIGTIGNQVESILRARGFRVTIIEVPYPAAPPRFVVHQSPQAGYPVALTDTITLEVSR